MDNFKTSMRMNKNLENFISEIEIIKDNNNIIIDDNLIHNLFMIIFNMLFLVRKIIKFFYLIIDKYMIYNVKYNKQLSIILLELNNNHNIIIDKYNLLFIDEKSIKYKELFKNFYINNKTNNKIMNSNIVYNNINLELLDITTEKFISDNINHDIKKLNYIDSINYDYVDIGFNNLYKLHIFNKLDDDIPFNLLVYIKDIDQIVIKIGNGNKFQFINSKLYKMYNIRNKINNDRSILCNNNIKKINKKCLNGINCKYYHDIIIGYKDNAHSSRQFSCNPIIYNCSNFKDGMYVKENIKKIDWCDAINLYQSNLSCLLIACIHASK